MWSAGSSDLLREGRAGTWTPESEIGRRSGASTPESEEDWVLDPSVWEA